MIVFLILIFSIIFYLGASNCNYNENLISQYNDDDLIVSPYYTYKMTKKECKVRIIIIKVFLYFFIIAFYSFVAFIVYVDLF